MAILKRQTHQHWRILTTPPCCSSLQFLVKRSFGCPPRPMPTPLLKLCFKCFKGAKRVDDSCFMLVLPPLSFLSTKYLPFLLELPKKKRTLTRMLYSKSSAQKYTKTVVSCFSILSWGYILFWKLKAKMVSLAHLFAQKTGTSHRNGSWDQKCFLEGLSNDIAGGMGNNVNLIFLESAGLRKKERHF